MEGYDLFRMVGRGTDIRKDVKNQNEMASKISTGCFKLQIPSHMSHSMGMFVKTFKPLRQFCFFANANNK